MQAFLAELAGLASEVRSAHFRRPTLTLWDRVQGGVGLGERLFEEHRQVLAAAAEDADAFLDLGTVPVADDGACLGVDIDNDADDPDPGDADGLMMLGMHAASGTGGFLAHTLTSRLASLEVNGRPLAEIELFAASLAPHNIPVIFFSGCPVACAQALSQCSDKEDEHGDQGHDQAKEEVAPSVPPDF